MQFTLDRAVLLDLLKRIKPAIMKRSTLPILSHVSLLVKDGLLRLQATNLEIGITLYHRLTDATDGALTLPHGHLVKMIEAMPDGPVTIQRIADLWKVHITAGGNESQLNGMDLEEFPVIPVNNEPTRCVIADVDLACLIRRTTFAAAKDDARPVFTGIHCEFSEHMVRFVSADTFRLAIATATAEVLGDDLDLIPHCLIPATSLDAFATLLPKKLSKGETSTPIAIAISANQVHLQYGDITLFSRLIEGTFPNWAAIVPKSRATDITIVTKDLRRALKGMLISAENSMHWYAASDEPFSWDDQEHIRPGTVTFEAEHDDIGWAKHVLPAQICGPDQAMIFNPNFMVDYAAAVVTDSVQLQANGADSPLTVMSLASATQDIDATFTYVGMPLYSRGDRPADYRVSLAQPAQKESAPVGETPIPEPADREPALVS